MASATSRPRYGGSIRSSAKPITNVGAGGGGSASNVASMYVILKPFEERQSPDRSAKAIIAQLKREWDAQIPEAKVTVNGAALTQPAAPLR